MAVRLHAGPVLLDQIVDGSHAIILGNRHDAPSEEVATIRAEVTMESMHNIREELRQPALDLQKLIPDVMSAHANLSRAAMAEGELSVATKELLALAIAVTRECDGCIVAHARAALRAGVTRHQVAESMGVVIAMNGGPGTVWGPRALRVYDEALADRQGPA
jgi:AhpD family alkylhydroperoxidase